jgi:putative ATP-dependent endonuclease of OLD family
MNIQNVVVKNFRLLSDISIGLERDATVVVGRNNSGKTSLTELLRRLLLEGTPSFKLEDFSLSAHDAFWKAYRKHIDGKPVDEVRQALPVIEVIIDVQYDADHDDLGHLGDFIVDLNPDCTNTFVIARYELREAALDAFFDDISLDGCKTLPDKQQALCKGIRDRLPQCYASRVLAQDPNDASNTRELEFSALRALIQGGFIGAQRGLDDTTHKGVNLLGKVLEQLLAAASQESAEQSDQEISAALTAAVGDIQQAIDSGFNTQLQLLMPAFSLFGYPGLSDPKLVTETTLDVDRLLKDHTRVHYAGVNGINLPESYNGLGTRNLVFILLKLYEIFKAYQAAERPPGMQLIFIEEPEVHLHPQMQEVFISKLTEIVALFNKKLPKGSKWPVQFVITTHSSHIANRASFDSLRYFLCDPAKGATARQTRVKNLREGLGGTKKEDRDFLHKYMTLARSDLLFADKAILIEGATERLLLPIMIRMLPKVKGDAIPLSSQYVSVVEVGGAYAHIFFGLLAFLELRTLIVTDLDAVDKDGGKACPVSGGTHTSNQCLRTWFGKKTISPAELLQKTDKDKTKGLMRIAYQIPEAKDQPCGRSFEAAFMLANRNLFGLDATKPADLEDTVWNKSAGIGSKADFAVQHAVEKTEWVAPKYIADGLQWLEQANPSSD